MPENGSISAAVWYGQQRLLEIRRQQGVPTPGQSGGYWAREWGVDHSILPTPPPASIAGDAISPAHAPIAPPKSQSGPGLLSNGSVSALARVYPDIAMAILRRKKAAAGRVWLLLRHWDSAGRGRVAVDEAARRLSGTDGERICGRRQLANLLRAGEGLFWRRDRDHNGRDWLRLASVARLAAGLGVERLTARPVGVPVARLLGSIGEVRAQLYATFHSGRTRIDLLSGKKRPRGPIARATLKEISGAAVNSQRNYERRAAVARHSAIAVGPRITHADPQELAWRRGHALFRLHDRQGRYGPPGQTYLAWQLPNEYTGPHAILSRGRLKRLNRALADLFHNGMTGNDERPAGAKAAVPAQRRFYGTAKAALTARHGRERYWRYRDAWLHQPPLPSPGDARASHRTPTAEVAL